MNSPDLLDTLQHMLAAERQEANLTRIDLQMMETARDEVKQLTDRVRNGENYQLIDRAEAIEEHIGAIVTFRGRKLVDRIGWPQQPENMTEHEAAYFDALNAATVGFRQAWGLRE